MAQNTKTGRNIRWFFNGVAVGLTRVKSLKPDKQTKISAVVEAGNPNVIEYAKFVPETSLVLDYNVISYGQLAKALGQAPGTEVPDIPDNFDILEKLIVPGTEGTLTEVAAGWALHQGVMVEKESWDQEVDKLIAVNITAKSVAPRRFDSIATAPATGINGLQNDTFTGNGVLTAFVLTKFAKGPLKDGKYTIRVEAPTGQTALRETIDYTVASTSSTTTLNFTVAPASSATPNILAWYAW